MNRLFPGYLKLYREEVEGNKTSAMRYSNCTSCQVHYAGSVSPIEILPNEANIPPLSIDLSVCREGGSRRHLRAIFSFCFH